MHSATMVTARLSEDETDIYAKHLDTSDEYDEGYDGVNDRSFDGLFYQQKKGGANNGHDDQDEDDEHSNAIVFGILLVTAIGVIAYALRQRFQSVFWKRE